MPRAPNAKVKEAEKMYLEGDKLIDIATKLNIPEGTVRRWKSTYKWDSERSECEGNNEANVRNKGAPKGNKNATGNKGGHAPSGNKNNLKHGVYARMLFSDLTEEEKEMLGIISPLEDEELLKNEYLSLTIREKRLHEKILIEKGKTKGLNIKDVTTRKLIVNGKEENETTTHVASTFERIVRLEVLLTDIQAKKIKCINNLHKMGVDDEKLMLEKAKLMLEVERARGEVKANSLADAAKRMEARKHGT